MDYVILRLLFTKTRSMLTKEAQMKSCSQDVKSISLRELKQLQLNEYLDRYQN